MKSRPFLYPAILIPMIVLTSLTTPHTKAESVIFSGIEGSSSSSHAYLGLITPMKGKQLGESWYQKFVLSSTAYGYQNDERGSLVDIDGRSSGIDAGVGRIWRSRNTTVDLSATLGYRDVKLSPYAPGNDKTGNLLTFNPQLMLWNQLSSSIDADLIANYATGTSSRFLRARIGVRPTEKYRIGLESKWMSGRNYAIGKQGLFIALTLSEKMTLEFNAGREDQDGKEKIPYAGVAISTTF